MFIIPFIHNHKTIKGIHVSIIQILTIGGKMLWKEDDGLDINQDILEPNGLYLSGSMIKKNNMIYCPIDQSRTALDDFYRWEEMSKEDEETFCWRTFYLFSEKQNQHMVLPIPATTMIHNRPLSDVIHPILQAQLPAVQHTMCGV